MLKATPKLLLFPVLALALTLTGCTSSGATSAAGPAGPAQESHLTKILESKTIKVAVSADSPGFGVMDASGAYAGFDIDVANALAKSLGAEIEYVVTTNESRIPLLQTDKADAVVATLTATNERAQVIEMSIPYAASATLFMAPAGSPFASYDDLAGKTVATSRGSVGEAILKADFPEIKIAAFNSTADSIQALKSNKVDALIENNAVIGALMQTEPDAFTIVEGADLRPALFSIGVKPGDALWTNYLNSFIRNYNVSGENEASLDKWFGMKMPSYLK